MAPADDTHFHVLSRLDIECLLRRTTGWRKELKSILFSI